MDKNYNIQFNRKCRQEIQWRYILNAIQYANNDIVFISHSDMMQYVIDKFFDFKKELNSKNIAEWLATCPSCIEIAHYPNEIENIGRAWGYCKTENSTERFVATWYERIANKFIQMCNKLNLEL